MYPKGSRLHISMLLNVNRFNTIVFMLEMIPINISGSEVSDRKLHVKLLRVTLDQHLKFSARIDQIIAKCRLAFHAICKLNRASVNSDSSLTLYFTRPTSSLSSSILHLAVLLYLAKPIMKDSINNRDTICM